MASRRIKRPAAHRFDPDRPYSGHYHFVVAGDVARPVGYCEDGPFRCDEPHKHAWGTLGVPRDELIRHVFADDEDDDEWIAGLQREYDRRKRRR